MFDIKTLLSREKNAKIQAKRQDNPFLKYVKNELASKLEELDTNSNNILNLDNFSCSLEITTQYDIIKSNFILHWCNDVISHLTHLQKYLSHNGILLINFAGGGSLKSLRRIMIEAETKCETNHSPHISPFISFEDIPELFKRCGFNEIISSKENIEFEYKTPLSFMHDIKKIGESNALQKREFYSISKDMHKFLTQQHDPFIDHLNLITVIAAKNKGTIKPRL